MGVVQTMARPIPFASSEIMFISGIGSLTFLVSKNVKSRERD